MKQISEGYNSVAQECSEYHPIQAAKTAAVSYEETEIEDAGCDSCIHYNNGECGVYKTSDLADY